LLVPFLRGIVKIVKVEERVVVDSGLRVHHADHALRVGGVVAAFEVVAGVRAAGDDEHDEAEEDAEDQAAYVGDSPLFL
jgi:hypothetical protein